MFLFIDFLVSHAFTHYFSGFAVRSVFSRARCFREFVLFQSSRHMDPGDLEPIGLPVETTIGEGRRRLTARHHCKNSSHSWTKTGMYFLLF
jgi:hypothetical protein